MANLKNYTSAVPVAAGWEGKNYNNNDDSTLSNRLVAGSQTQVIETLSSLGYDLP